MNFRVGQKVVCVDESETASIAATGLTNKWNDLPIKGQIYTVSATGLYHSFDPTNEPCIMVAEIQRPFHFPLWAKRFRPLVSRPTEISIFTSMLKHKESAL